MNRTGLYVVPKGLKRTRAKKSLRPLANARWSGMPLTEKPKVEYMYRDADGKIVHLAREWKRPQTEAAIAEWMEDYFERVAAGYLPAGFDAAPVPFCARVTLGGRVLAEWRRPEQKRA